MNLKSGLSKTPNPYVRVEMEVGVLSGTFWVERTSKTSQPPTSPECSR